jgi:4-aminobutyrate aminotransferase
MGVPNFGDIRFERPDESKLEIYGKKDQRRWDETKAPIHSIPFHPSIGGLRDSTPWNTARVSSDSGSRVAILPALRVRPIQADAGLRRTKYVWPSLRTKFNNDPNQIVVRCRVGEPQKSSRSEEIFGRWTRAISGSNSQPFYPLVVKEAHDCAIVDVDGKEYLDFNAGWTVAGVGYSNPEVVQAICGELGKSAGLSAGTFPSEVTLDFAEALIDITPGTFAKKVWFGNSGTDSCAAAYKLFPLVTKKPRVISFYGGMHGVDLAGIAMGGDHRTARFEVPHMVSKVPYAYCYRCPYGLKYPSCGIYCASGFIEEQLFKYINPPEDTSFMIVEAIQSDSGDVVPPPGYLEKLKKTCDKYGLLLVVDEVKIGFGRTGKMFGIEHSESVIPDAIALGKSIALGIPCGALVARKELLDTGFAASTLSGNTISAAAGLATLRVLKKMKLLENAEKMGDYMMKRLDEVKERHRLIGDVRGKGLIIGVEFVKSRRTKEPAKLETAKVLRRSWQLGLLIVSVGPDENVIELTPPLTISRENVDRGVDILEDAIGQVESEMPTSGD